MIEESKFYVLTKELTVDDPDGSLGEDLRKLGQPVTLKAGTRLKKLDRRLAKCGSYGGISTRKQTKLIMPHLEPAEYKIGQSLKATAEETLAALGELGIVTKDDMERANEFLLTESASQGDMKNLLYRNWIDWYPS